MNALDKVLPHFPERIAGTNQHSSHRDRPDDVAIQMAGKCGPGGQLITSRRYEVPINQLGSQEENQQRDKQAPRKDTSREVKGTKFRTDNIADPNIGRCCSRCGNGGYAAPHNLGRVILQPKLHK